MNRTTVFCSKATYVQCVLHKITNSTTNGTTVNYKWYYTKLQIALHKTTYLEMYV